LHRNHGPRNLQHRFAKTVRREKNVHPHRRGEQAQFHVRQKDDAQVNGINAVSHCQGHDERRHHDDRRIHIHHAAHRQEAEVEGEEEGENEQGDKPDQ